MTQTNSTPKRRWFRFNLRTLLIAVVLLSLPLGWLTMKMRQAERQRRVVETIREAGGEVSYGYQVRGLESPAPAWLVGLMGVDFFSDLSQIDFNGCTKPDAEHLNGLTSLRFVDLGDTQVTDAGLEHLKGLTSLRFLDLADTQVSDAGLQHL